MNALALIVVVSLISMEPENIGEEGEGSEPSMVKWIVAPTVLQLSLTLWSEV